MNRLDIGRMSLKAIGMQRGIQFVLEIQIVILLRNSTVSIKLELKSKGYKRIQNISKSLILKLQQSRYIGKCT